VNDTSQQYKEMTVSTAMNQLKRKIPYGWDLNIYRGCGHGCKYCYAMYTHGYLEDDDFFGSIYAKTNIVEVLEQELSAPGWKREIVNIGGVTDSYQPAEAQFKLMPDILKLMIKYKTPVIISSKSALVLRDYDLIEELSRVTLVNIAQTITVMDEEIRKKIEPGSADSMSRFEVLREFRKTNASIGVHVMPIIPFVTDSEENFDRLFAEAAAVGADYVLPGTLYLRGKTRPYFFKFIKDQFPEYYEQLLALYKTGGADKTYKNGLYLMVNRLRDKYGLSGNYSKPLKARLN
jgi:DNA repair photolyase